jgi:O-antigen/teichoic acid export membrane protein
MAVTRLYSQQLRNRFMTILILAYIDPGVGALLWQTIIAAFVGLLFYLKKTRRWIVGGFRKMFGRSQKPSGTVAEIPAKETMKAKSDVR